MSFRGGKHEILLAIYHILVYWLFQTTMAIISLHIKQPQEPWGHKKQCIYLAHKHNGWQYRTTGLSWAHSGGCGCLGSVWGLLIWAGLSWDGSALLPVTFIFLLG